MARHRAPDAAQHVAPVVPLGQGRNFLPGNDSAAVPGPVKAPVDLVSSEAFVDDLTLIAADDKLLDRIAAGQAEVFQTPPRFAAGFPAGSLAPLLATWRSELIDPRLPSLPTADQVTQAVRAMHSPTARRSRRALRPMIGVAVAISALLFGSAAVGAQSATPGDVLWPLAQVLYSGHADSVQARVAARDSLESARSALSHGDAPRALIALTSAASDLPKVSPTDGLATMQADYNVLLDQATSAVAGADSTESAPVQVLPAAGAPLTSSRSSQDSSLPSTAKATVAVGSASSSGSRSGSGSSSSSAGGSTAPVRTSASSAASSGSTAPGSTSVGVPPPPVVVTQPPSTSVAPSTAVIPPSTPASSVGSIGSTPSPTDSPTSDPVTTDPGTPTTVDSPTTQDSTTSVLPTPTPTPADTPTVPQGNAVSIASVGSAADVSQ